VAERPHITVDRDICMGSGMCCMYAPNTFDIDDETRSFVKNAHGDPIDMIRTAVEACPTGALTLSAPQD
jgi:ferredoxin